MRSDNLMKSSETGKVNSQKHSSESDLINFTEWLIFKVKIIYGRGLFEGDTPEEASAIRQEWQDLVLNIGKKGVLSTIDYLLSGHHGVPTFPPSPVEFRKCYRINISPSVINGTFQKDSAPLTEEQKQKGCQSIKQILVGLKTGCFVEVDTRKNLSEVSQRIRKY